MNHDLTQFSGTPERSHRYQRLKFQHWVAHCRKTECENEFAAIELLTCPLIWCRKGFHSHTELVNHIKTCSSLDNGEYWCPKCLTREHFTLYPTNKEPTENGCRIWSGLCALQKAVQGFPKIGFKAKGLPNGSTGTARKTNALSTQQAGLETDIDFVSRNSQNFFKNASWASAFELQGSPDLLNSVPALTGSFVTPLSSSPELEAQEPFYVGNSSNSIELPSSYPHSALFECAELSSTRMSTLHTKFQSPQGVEHSLDIFSSAIPHAAHKVSSEGSTPNLQVPHQSSRKARISPEHHFAPEKTLLELETATGQGNTRTAPIFTNRTASPILEQEASLGQMPPASDSGQSRKVDVLQILEQASRAHYQDCVEKLYRFGDPDLTSSLLSATSWSSNDALLYGGIIVLRGILQNHSPHSFAELLMFSFLAFTMAGLVDQSLLESGDLFKEISEWCFAIESPGDRSIYLKAIQCLWSPSNEASSNKAPHSIPASSPNNVSFDISHTILDEVSRGSGLFLETLKPCLTRATSISDVILTPSSAPTHGRFNEMLQKGAVMRSIYYYIGRTYIDGSKF